MARKYIKISSVSDIDLSRIGVGNIENRYIDSQGNRYATRFNKRKRKVEIVRIALGLEEAQAIVQRSHGTKVSLESKAAEVKVHPAPFNLPPWIAQLGIAPASRLNSVEYLNEIEKECNRISERFRGIISNIKRSEVGIDSGGHHDFNLDIATAFDRDIQAPLHETQKMVSELTRFPKPMSNYLAYLNKKHKVYFETLNSERQKEYIKAATIGTKMLKAIKGGLDLIQMMRENMEHMDPEALKGEQKKAFENAMQSMDFTESGLREETGKIIKWFETASLI